ncbi:MAG: ABC transporter substrate-binding protein [Candidatus Dormibacteraeota bacterium]|nr:ABC transporter substrate-binding protein [Candidatus Dormibacteraeota bacterium]
MAIGLLAACGGSTPSPAPAASLEPVTLTVGVIPIVDVAPIYLGVNQGFFKDQALTLSLKLAQGGAAIIPAAVSGDYQFGFSNTVSEILAQSKGLKLKIVSQGVQTGSDPNNDPWAILATNSAVSQCKDLEGKTVAVNTLKNIGEVSIKAACDKGGVDVSKFKLIEMNFPDMLPALQAGRIDAMWSAEPFVTQAKLAGAHVISYNVVAVQAHLPVATYFATADYAGKNPGIVKRFVAAVNKSLDYANAHQSEVRSIVNQYAKIPPAVLQAMVLPYWSHDLNKPAIDKLASLMVKYGLLTAKPDLAQLYY